jgi:CBS domain containing-hemolysin-like protein
MHDPADRASITGIVTARDVVTKILAAESSADGYEGADGLSREPVFLRAMTFDPVMALDESAELSSILEEMQRRRFR